MIKWWSIPSLGRGLGHLRRAWSFCLQDSAAALFPERVDLLAGESYQQAVLLLVFGDVLEDIRDGLGHGHTLDCSLATKLFRHHPKIRNAQSQQTLSNAIDGLLAAFAPPPHYSSNNSNFRISPSRREKKSQFSPKKHFPISHWISSGIFFLTFAAANCWQRYPCARYRINLSWRLMYPQSRKQQGI